MNAVTLNVKDIHEIENFKIDEKSYLKVVTRNRVIVSFQMYVICFKQYYMQFYKMFFAL